jgi:Protein of unknown function (DUF4230)
MTKAQGWVLTVGVILFLLVIAGSLLFGIQAATGLPGKAWDAISGFLHPTPAVYPDPVTVIREVRSLARLETVQYTVEKVIVISENQGPLAFLFGDKLLLVAHGTVIAGIDLGKMQDGDLRIDTQGNAYMTLPPAEIFSVYLDNSKTQVYDRQTGWLRVPDKDMETQARQAAEGEIRAAAVEDGILKTALANAKIYLEHFLLALDVKCVYFTDATPIPSQQANASLQTGISAPLTFRLEIR